MGEGGAGRPLSALLASHRSQAFPGCAFVGLRGAVGTKHPHRPSWVVHVWLPSSPPRSPSFWTFLGAHAPRSLQPSVSPLLGAGALETSLDLRHARGKQGHVREHLPGSGLRAPPGLECLGGLRLVPRYCSGTQSQTRERADKQDARVVSSDPPLPV